MCWLSAEHLLRQHGSCHGPEEQKNLDLSDPSGQRKRSIFSWFLTGLTSLSSGKVTMLLPTQVSRIDSLIFFQVLKLILIRFTEFPSEFNSNTLLRQPRILQCGLGRNMCASYFRLPQSRPSRTVTPSSGMRREMVFDKYSPWLLLL